MADTADLGSAASAWGFESLQVHQFDHSGVGDWRHFPRVTGTVTSSGLTRLTVLDTRLQVAGNRLQHAWETLDGYNEHDPQRSRSHLCLSADGNHLLGAQDPG